MNLGVVWLDDAAQAVPQRVGTKAASLSGAFRDSSVPDGFCISGAGVLAGGAAGRAAARAFTRALARAYVALGRRCGRSEPAVAVRSSGREEDGTMTSFAGQHLTVLNVRGMSALESAAVSCLASFLEERPRAYRARTRPGSVEPSPTVLVQAMVVADVSAVVFSAAGWPADEVVVNASWGFGPSVVEGTVTPDLFRFSRRDLTLIEAVINRKDRMTVATREGVDEVPVPPLLRRARSLREEQAREAAALALALESKLGTPVDLECAWESGTLYLLQCRPITAALPMVMR